LVEGWNAGGVMAQLKDTASALVLTVPFEQPVVAVVSVEVEAHGYVPGAAQLVDAASIQSGALLLTLNGGADGELYTITARAEFDGGVEAERQLQVMVVTKDWAMPAIGTAAGVAGWLDLHEFIDRFGLDETISATATEAGGALDRAFLIAKLQDAQAEAEANVAARYALPLVDVPAILKTAVGDLARARLYRRGVPDEVAENAKIQRRLLERISSGSLPLPLPQGSQAAEADESVPASGWSGGRTYTNGLDDF
jgi:phage gp36-like protein